MTTAQPEAYRHDVARYPDAPCSHCGTKLRMYQATVWVHPYCCVPEHRVNRKASAGGSTSIICRTCARKLGFYE